MSLYSQRKGLKPAIKAIQRESFDEETRNALWSILWGHYQLYSYQSQSYGYEEYPYRSAIKLLYKNYWTGYFKEAADTQPEFHRLGPQLRAHFFGTSWNEVLDFLDFTAQHLEANKTFVAQVNAIFEKESCPYRFVGGQITDLISEPEIAAIQSVVESADKDVGQHIGKALSLLSNRKNPDYHNSIKESVSAIEAAARRSSGNKSATLSDALRIINSKNPIHPALLKMLQSLYGYAGDESGVRHAAKDSGTTVTQAEARLILVIASATCGFLAAKAG